jgi:hypothetical protein
MDAKIQPGYNSLHLFMFWDIKSHLTSSDHKPSLDFAASSVALILARWELTQLSQKQSAGTITVDQERSVHSRISTVGQMVIRSSHDVLENMIKLCTTTKLIKPIYDSLLGAYAAVTLVEYVDYLDDLQASYSLMERANTQAKASGTVSEVLNWAVDMMCKKSLDLMSLDQVQLNNEYAQERPTLWIPFDFVDSHHTTHN